MVTHKLTTVVIDALEDIKARDIMLINVSKLTSVFDYIAVASADSTRQTKALAKNVMDKVKEWGGWIYGTEGEQSGEWVLVDCGDVVVHIMQPVVREHYKLEELWGDGKLEYPKPAAPKRKPAKAPAVKKTGTGGKAKSKKPPTAKAIKTTQVGTVKSKAAGTGKAGATATVAKEKKAVAKSNVMKKKATGKITAKLAITARKKVAVTTLKKPAAKKPVAKKPAAKKPVTRRKAKDQ